MYGEFLPALLYKSILFLYFHPMKRYVQHEPFNIYQFEAADWQHPEHKHSYFEIIFIRKGTGEHSINGNIFTYSAGDVFLLGPEDYHYFRIKDLTSFCYIRFTETFIKDHTTQKSHRWVRTLEYILSTSSQASGSIVTKSPEKKLLNHLLTVLVYEYGNQQEENSYEEIINGIMKALLGILARNILKEGAGTRKAVQSSPLMTELVAYIHQHIYNPEILRLESLADKFNYSSNYLSSLFKRETGESLQQYILKYKLKLIQNRLQFSDMNLAQITQEFGFTDASHFNKLFKKYHGTSPSTFRNNLHKN